MALPCVVLGGGLGTRMRPYTDALPKPLLPVAGTPFVIHQLRWLASQGITDVVYSIGYLGQLIRDTVADERALAGAVRFVDEGQTPLGTGGAVRLAIAEASLPDAFFVLYGDSYLDVELDAVAAAFDPSTADALMTVFRNHDPRDKNNAAFDGKRVRRYDKAEPDPAGAGMGHIDYGLSILRRDAVTALVPEQAPSDLADLFTTLSANGRLAGYEAKARFHEIGSPHGLAELKDHLASRATP
jgi:NDP-sugar pyrophosphorylase family protein